MPRNKEQGDVTGSYVGTDRDGSRVWFYDGVRHRTDGPAVISPNGRRSWYLYGKPCTERELLQKITKEEMAQYILNDNNF